MPRNKFGGNKAKKGKNVQTPTEIVFAESDQQYAKITKTLGNRRFEVLCLIDKKIRIAHIRGNMRRSNWITINDIVLVSLRNFQDDKCDIIYKYTEEEKIKLIKLGELTYDDTKTHNEIQEEEEEEDGFKWEEI
jgi:translation initiation factor 1A